ncbi:protein mono-ADP-ribosyltransferase PARP12 [Mastacembelus armatus]|nr:protein mono-ADP-ribosyltransferase PARP12-like [Mastacembelus armatus]
MMELEIFRFICSNQGAANSKELEANLGFDVSGIVSNQEKFALLYLNGQQRVVARTRLRLCRDKECLGTCRGLHLCKNILFSGTCHFVRMRGGCSFSHELNSEYNTTILREHELESLSRRELCTLLLQTDNMLLPSICHDYNNGRCQKGDECQRLHVCELNLNRDCSCFRTHDFNAPQPLKNLKKRALPDDLIHSLKPVYANIEALRFFDKRADRGNNHHKPFPGDTSGAAGADVYSDTGTTRAWYRGRGRGGNRGHRRGRGGQGTNNYHQLKQRTYSTSDILADIDSLDLYTSGELNKSSSPHNSSTSDVSAAANDTDSDNGQNGKQTDKPNKTQGAVRGRGGHHRKRGNRGNQNKMKKACSTNDLTSGARGKDANGNDGPKKLSRDKTEICMYFIKGHCIHEDKCFKAHDKMPYRWQVQEGNQWLALPGNETIEKDYCDPKNTCGGGSPSVHFDTMTRGTNKVRRLSTINSLLQPTFIHTTEWAWYWEDEFGNWNLYASTAGEHKVADINSAKLEQRFLENDKDVLEFAAGSQLYSLSFQDMIQTNKKYGTKRLVRRRPVFVSAVDVKTRKVRRPQSEPNFATVPEHWDKTQIPPTGFQRVSLPHTSDEFKEIQALFCHTMRGFDIVKIERIQNRALWEVFQWQKNQMKSKNRVQSVMEKKLFHGTDTKHVDAICSANFDWRICGTHGTAFGKGSYFARDAKYSHNYAGDSNVRSMFVSRVLVGDYTKGSSGYLRPPSKDGGDVNFYDSCVDDVSNPSIFVVFEKHQIFPEYLLQYKTMDALVDLYGTASVPAPKSVTAPRAAPQPSKPAAQPSTSIYQPTTASYQPTTASYQPTTASYRQPTTSSYQPTTSSYQPSTASYRQPTTSSYQFTTTSHQPTTTSHQPSTTSYQFTTTSSSFYQPSTSVNHNTSSDSSPTLSYNSRTGMYQYQRTTANTSSPSPTPKKNSDSCVIA